MSGEYRVLYYPLDEAFQNSDMAPYLLKKRILIIEMLQHLLSTGFALCGEHGSLNKVFGGGWPHQMFLVAIHAKAMDDNDTAVSFVRHGDNGSHLLRIDTGRHCQRKNLPKGLRKFLVRRGFHSELPPGEAGVILTQAVENGVPEGIDLNGGKNEGFSSGPLHYSHPMFQPESPLGTMDIECLNNGDLKFENTAYADNGSRYVELIVDAYTKCKLPDSAITSEIALHLVASELADSVLAIADFPISRMTNDVLKALQADKKVREYIEERRAEANNLSDISEDMFAGPTGGARNSSRKFMKGTRKGR